MIACVVGDDPRHQGLERRVPPVLRRILRAVLFTTQPRSPGPGRTEPDSGPAAGPGQDLLNTAHGLDQPRWSGSGLAASSVPTWAAESGQQLECRSARASRRSPGAIRPRVIAA